MMRYIPEEIVNIILTFHNPYKYYFTNSILVEMKQKVYYKSLMRQLMQYRSYDRHRNVICFHKYSILTKINT